jgi:uncharacterized protein DUF3558
MKTRPMIVAVIVLAALLGCSKNSGSSPTTGNPVKPANAGAVGGGGIDPCALITTSDATAVLGEPAKDGAPHSYQSTKQCQWDAANGSVAILVYLGGQKESWPSIRDQAKRSPKYSDVQGLGDAAFSNGFDLHILKGDDMFQIGVSGPFQDPVDRATTVAKKALANA